MDKKSRFEKITEKVRDTLPGEDGLKRIPSNDFIRYNNREKLSLLGEPRVLTSDGDDVLVVMTVEQYLELAHRVEGFKAKEFMRIEGEMWGKM